MLKGKTVGIVVPAYNEEKHIGQVIETMPDFADAIIVVNDASKDRTADVVTETAARRKGVVLVNRPANGGNGQALIDGYLKALEMKIDVVTVMDGDGQMDPADLEDVVMPVAAGRVDYTMGNRLSFPGVSKIMPMHRFLGNALLTLLTKFATGYWHLVDPQCSYAAISYAALKRIDIASMARGYGYNADVLNRLNIYGFRAVNVDVRPVYDGQVSRIRLHSYIPNILRILTRLFFRRLWQRYVVRDFHPLVLFYLFALSNFFAIIIPFTIRFLYLYRKTGEAPHTTLIILLFTTMITFQSVLFAIWMDMDYNKRA
jgi:glycosyltransferase involved in cell wall biosynthesis